MPAGWRMILRLPPTVAARAAEAAVPAAGRRVAGATTLVARLVAWRQRWRSNERLAGRPSTEGQRSAADRRAGRRQTNGPTMEDRRQTVCRRRAGVGRGGRRRPRVGSGRAVDGGPPTEGRRRGDRRRRVDGPPIEGRRRTGRRQGGRRRRAGSESSMEGRRQRAVDGGQANDATINQRWATPSTERLSRSDRRAVIAERRSHDRMAIR